MMNHWAQTPTDHRFVTRINNLSNGDSEYWAFRKEAKRDGVHGLIQYPAMMIPSMQAKLLEIAREEHGNVQRVLDPFVGAGTMLTEVMEQGLDFTGYDINPLAILACKVKAGPFPVEELYNRIQTIRARIAADSLLRYEVGFSGQKKWFTKGANIGLSRIRRAVQAEPDLWTRQFCWLSMAETIRRCSNSRTSTYKLHIKPVEEIDATSTEIMETFIKVLMSNAKRIQDQHNVFIERDVLERGMYRNKIEVNFDDITSIDTSKTPDKFDLLFTSPPYGDNATTIPYGQFSYLSLQWIPLEDIDLGIPASINANTHAIDTASIGGSLKKSADKAESLASRSEAFKQFYWDLGDSRSSYAKRLSSYCYDMHRSIESLSKMVAPNGYMVWTLGNRSLNGKRVPLDAIILELLESNGMRRVAQFLRPIPSKRMPTRNNCSDTMQHEIVVIAGA